MNYRHTAHSEGYVMNYRLTANREGYVMNYRLTGLIQLTGWVCLLGVCLISQYVCFPDPPAWLSARASVT